MCCVAVVYCCVVLCCVALCSTHGLRRGPPQSLTMPNIDLLDTPNTTSFPLATVAQGTAEHPPLPRGRAQGRLRYFLALLCFALLCFALLCFALILLLWCGVLTFLLFSSNFFFPSFPPLLYDASKVVLSALDDAELYAEHKPLPLHQVFTHLLTLT